MTMSGFGSMTLQVVPRNMSGRHTRCAFQINITIDIQAKS